MDTQENDFDQNETQNIFSKENNYFSSETFINTINESLKSEDKEKIKSLFEEIKIAFIGKNLINSFSEFLKKIEGENLFKFFEILQQINFNSRLFLQIVAEGILGFLHQKFSDAKILEISLNFLIEKTSLKNLRPTKLQRLINILTNGLMNNSQRKKIEEILLSLDKNFIKNFNVIFLFGNLINSKALNDMENLKEFKGKLEDIFINFYCEKILLDDERDKNLAKQRILNKFFCNFSKEKIFPKIFNEVQDLLLRSSNNFKFLENLFLFGNLKFDENFAAEIFSKYKDYFFNEKTFESAKLSFKKIVKNLDEKILAEKLLGLNFLADKADLNLNLCYYLSHLLYSNDIEINGLKQSKDNKEIIQFTNISWEISCKILLFILKKLEMLNENNKPTFEIIIDNLVKGFLLLRENLNYRNFSAENEKEISKEKLPKNLNDDLLKQIKKILTSSNFNYFYSQIYLIIGELVKNIQIEFDKQILENIFNNINFVQTISLSNYKNGLSAISLGLTLCSFGENMNLYNTYKKQISQAVSVLISNEAFLIFRDNLQNSQFSPNAFENICLYNSFSSLVSKNAKNKNLINAHNEDIKLFSRLISLVSFFKSDKIYEKIFLKKIYSEIEDKETMDLLINNILTFIMNNYSWNENNNNNEFLYQKNFEKFSFDKVSIFLNYYAQFINNFEEKDFMKFLLLINLNNLNNNTKQNTNNKSDFTLYKNIFLQNLSNLKEDEIEQKLIKYIEENHKTLISFILSDIGLFNRLNPTIRNSCLNIIKFICEKNLENVLNSFIKYTFEYLEIEKLQFIDEIAKYYRAEMEYISYYDMENLVESLMTLEKKYKNSLALNMIPEKKVVIPVNINAGNAKGAKGKQPQKQQQNTSNQAKSKDNKEKEKENKKVDKDEKIIEFKNYLENFIFQTQQNFEKNLSEIFQVLSILNKSLKINENKNNNEAKYKNHKENLIFSIKKIWSIFKISFTKESIKNQFMKIFFNNKYTKIFNLEFSILMQAEQNPKLLNNILDNYPNVLETFNEKLNNLLTNNSDKIVAQKLKIFEIFDFVVIRILFFSILAPEFANEQKSNSVDNLIKIIETLNKEILNFEDISTLAVSLLKTSYNSENLTVMLEIFMRRCSKENFLTLCNDLLDYEYVAKLSFLQQILNLNFSYLREYKNLSYKIWILIFDENDNISSYALKIWNKFSLYLDEDYGNSNEFKLAFTNHTLVDSINSANRAFAFILPNQIENLLKQYENFYEKDLEEYIEKVNSEDYDMLDLEKINRLKLFDFIDETIELCSEDCKRDLLAFLTRISDMECNNDIFVPMNKSIFNIIKSISNEKILQNIIESSEENIRNMTGKSEKEINLKYLKIVLMILNSILMKEDNNDTSNKKGMKISPKTLDNLYDSIHCLAKKINDYDILLLIGVSFLYLSRENTKKSEKLLQDIVGEYKAESKENFNLGKSFILASLVKFFGISTFKTAKIYDAIIENMKKHKNIVEKQNSMLLIKVFSFSLKKLFEPYLVEIFDKICELITDREEKVRNCTQDAVKSFMKELSGYGVKSIMPRLIKDLHSMNWKSKVVNIEILGQFAFCAPKQLSVYIPKVIKEIMIVFKDPHYKVQECAVNVLKDISSVIKNPEIVELSSLLIDAISNPPEKSKDALTAILETQFKHAIDPPSLALIIPIIDYNLKVENANLKKMAAHVIGSIANLITDPIHIFHYLDIIMPNLKIALFDGIPECRNAMSKAIGSLAKSLGVDYLQEIILWLDKYLTYQSETVQKSGAAQGYAEILVAMGDAFIDRTLPQIINKAQGDDPITKEGYLSIFVFLPGCMEEKFEKYFDLIFPLIIDGFSNDHENVRNVSNKIFEICIRLFAKRNTRQLLDPLLIRLFDPNWRIRNSSIALIKTLIMNLNKEFFKESSTSFPKELRDQVLNYTFILKADTYGNTNTIANMIWRDYVDNIPKYLSRILKNIYEQIMELLTIADDDTLDIAEGIVKMLCTKFSDKYFYELVPIMKENLIEKKDQEKIVYATFYIIQLSCAESSEKILLGFKEKILKIVHENINTEHSSVRKLLASVIFEMSNKFRDNQINRSFIHHVMKLARGKNQVEQNNLLEIVGYLIEISNGEVLPNAMSEMFKQPYEEGFITLAENISETITTKYEEAVEYKDLYNKFIDVLPVLPEISVRSLISITVRLNEEFLPIFIEFLEKFKSKIDSGFFGEQKNAEKQALTLSEMIFQFADKTTQNIESVNNSLFEMIVSMFIYTDVNILQNLGKAIKFIVEKSEKENLDSLLETFLRHFAKLEEKLEVEGINKSSHITANFKIVMENLLYFVQMSLLHAENKILAADYVQTVIEYTTREIIKPFIMKFNGPLIRILSEKLSPFIKEKILENIKSILIKCKEDIKGISPQLQSVFIKTLSDTSMENCERAQMKAGENIMRLLQYYPRTDVIANDILKSIINKCEKNEGMFSIIEIEILSDIIRFYGSQLKKTVVDDHYKKIQNLLNNNTNNQIPEDMIIMLLSSYTKLSKEVSDCEKLVEDTSISQELPRKLFNFITIFNGNLLYFNAHKRNAVKLIKPLPKDQAVIMLKNLGKIMNKYSYFIDFDRQNIEKIVESFLDIIGQIIIETDILTSVNPMIDANLCVFLLSLGYVKNYENNSALFKKVMEFIFKVVESAKVNSQLLINCLSLIALKEIKPNADHIEISNSLYNMNIDKEQVEKIEEFLKKIYYFKDSN